MRTRTSFEYVASTAFGLSESAFQFEPPSTEGDQSDDRAADPGGNESDVSRNDISYFMDLASRYPLLGVEEERELGLTLWRERARLLSVLRGSSRREPRVGVRAVTPSTRRRLARVEQLARSTAQKKRAPSGVSGKRLKGSLAKLDQARSRLVEHNLRLVVWVAKRFRGRGFDFVDLIQEGSLGLMRAVDRFDPRVGARFSTFATHWIQQGIRRALAEKARSIRIPVNRIPEVRQIVSVRARLGASLGRAALAEEIATGCRLSLRKVEELLPAIGSMESIDAPLPATDKLLSETLADRLRPSPLEAAIAEETRSAVKAVLDELPCRQRIILAMRHGIDYPRECTLDEIGDTLGLSRERIRQVEKVAAAAVRERIEKRWSQLARPV
ncbi:MAG TPA: RNA polymerase sigma factor RpoD/SigA [Vicinamibacteria bacterium]